VALLFGYRVQEEEIAQLLRRLRVRGTPSAADAVRTIRRGRAVGEAPETATETREAILVELREWNDIEHDAPLLAALRDRLSAAKRASR
jgi:hypothetical protein